jgi:hypothetical protein
MHDFHVPAMSSPADQAHGLRRMFAGKQVMHIALVANPHVAFSGVVLERLTTVLAEKGLNTLVVDAADSSPAPHELAALDLRSGIETLSPRVSYLAARGLPLRHVDTRGSSAHWLDSLCTAAPQARVLLVHASASDLSRLFARRALRPVLLAADHPESLTHAYAAMKLLVQRCAFMSYDLLLAAPPSAARVPLIAERLASCAESFLGAALCDWLAIDPACDVRDPPGAALSRLVSAQLRLQDEEPAEEGMAPSSWQARTGTPQAAYLN